MRAWVCSELKFMMVFRISGISFLSWVIERSLSTVSRRQRRSGRQRASSSNDPTPSDLFNDPNLSTYPLPPNRLSAKTPQSLPRSSTPWPALPLSSSFRITLPATPTSPLPRSRPQHPARPPTTRCVPCGAAAWPLPGVRPPEISQPAISMAIRRHAVADRLARATPPTGCV